MSSYVPAATIRPLTDVGSVTIALLGINHPDRVLEREALRAVDRYPGTSAAERMRMDGSTE